MVLETQRYPGGYQQQSYSAYQGTNGGYSNYQGVTEYTAPYSGYPQLSTYPSSHGQHHNSGWPSGGGYCGNGATFYPGGGVVKPGYVGSYYEDSYTHGSQGHQGHGSQHHQGYGIPPQHQSPPLHQGHGSPQHHQSHGIPYGHGHGSPQHHQGHGSPPHHQGHGSPPHHQNHGIPYGHGHGSPQHHQGHESPHHQSQSHAGSHGLGKTHSYGSGITTKINKLTHGHNTYESGGPNYGHSPSGVNHGYQKPSWVLKGLDDDE